MTMIIMIISISIYIPNIYTNSMKNQTEPSTIKKIGHQPWTKPSNQTNEIPLIHEFCLVVWFDDHNSNAQQSIYYEILLSFFLLWIFILAISTSLIVIVVVNLIIIMMNPDRKRERERERERKKTINVECSKCNDDLETYKKKFTIV